MFHRGLKKHRLKMFVVTKFIIVERLSDIHKAAQIKNQLIVLFLVFLLVYHCLFYAKLINIKKYLYNL
jgi:hypothetical protein